MCLRWIDFFACLHTVLIQASSCLLGSFWMRKYFVVLFFATKYNNHFSTQFVFFLEMKWKIYGQFYTLLDFQFVHLIFTIISLWLFMMMDDFLPFIVWIIYLRNLSGLSCTVKFMLDDCVYMQLKVIHQ